MTDTARLWHLIQTRQIEKIADQLSAPTSAPPVHPRAAGTPESQIGPGATADADREGAEIHYLDNRRHSVHADLYACHPDETGGLAS